MKKVALALALAAVGAPAPAVAQLPSLPAAVEAVQEPQEPSSISFSFFAGRFIPTDWSDAVVLGSIGPTGIFEQLIVHDLGEEPATGWDVTATYWRGRLGARAHAGYASSCVAAGADCPLADRINLKSWMFDIGGAVGLRPYNPRQVFRPYVFAGIGAVAYDLSRPIGPEFLTLVTEQPRQDDAPLIIVDDSTQFLLSVDELALETTFAVNAGIGTDIRIPVRWGAVGIRLELSDHVSDSPVDLRVTRLNASFFGAAPETRVQFEPVHHFRAAAGLVLDFELGRR
jgi:hypothetical protein